MSSLYSSLMRFPEQWFHAAQQMSSVSFPTSYKSINHVVVVGMGGSALGAHLLTTALRTRIKAPMEIVSDYTVPGSAGKNTLVVCSSFSGTTEEVIAAYKEAGAKKLKRFVICAGGELARLAKRDGVPMYLFDPADLAPQPRYGTAFMTLGLLAALRGLRLVKMTNAELESLIEHLDAQSASAARAAKKIAKALHGRVPMMISSEHLEGAVHVFANQLNESAKCFSARYAIPELNHHLMEGLTFPKEVVKKFTFVFFESDLYHPRVQKRYGLTCEIVKKQGANVMSVQVGGTTPLEQACEVVQLGAFVTYETAMLARVEPEKIPWVDWFKARMK